MYFLNNLIIQLVKKIIRLSFYETKMIIFDLFYNYNIILSYPVYKSRNFSEFILLYNW